MLLQVNAVDHTLDVAKANPALGRVGSCAIGIEVVSV
jgi:hypothetical protein